MTLPAFMYHPDPIATGMVKASVETCVCCSAARGFVYAGAVYSIEEYIDCICPWCIADGSAARELDCTFTDEAGVGGDASWDAVSDAVVREVATRTPGFCGWQQERWWTHCGDAAAFLGRAGHLQLLACGSQAVEAIRRDTGITDDAAWASFLGHLSAEGSPTAYVFRCVKCGQYGGYQDCD